ncbi:beta carbonic anhydrase 1-like [Glossina fuscipes]|uniref:Carbonic anhydrase n=1 Tax=Glossina fuscipes TaxID=7396 RepID=A0A9C5ZL18_9MUSC|nr:beta carbonic anhydrase 1-like [Glossina fuscipes]
MFVVRNDGNLIPHAHHFQDEHFSCEPAALELGCVVNDILHSIVCGHSDCKAMNLLYMLRDPDFASNCCSSIESNIILFFFLMQNNGRLSSSRLIRHF